MRSSAQGVAAQLSSGCEKGTDSACYQAWPQQSMSGTTHCLHKQAASRHVRYASDVGAWLLCIQRSASWSFQEG